MAADTFIGTRVERRDAEALTILSKQMGRSVSSEIRLAVRAWVEAAAHRDDEPADTGSIVENSPDGASSGRG